MAKLPVQLSDRERRACTKLADSISPAFKWSHSPQGKAYWEEVRRNLYALAAFTVYPYNEETNDPGILADHIEEGPHEDDNEIAEDPEP